MMDFQNERWVIQCDDCGEVLDTEARDKEEAIQVANDNGWRITKQSHYCDICADEQDEDND